MCEENVEGENVLKADFAAPPQDLALGDRSTTQHWGHIAVYLFVYLLFFNLVSRAPNSSPHVCKASSVNECE